MSAPTRQATPRSAWTPSRPASPLKTSAERRSAGDPSRTSRRVLLSNTTCPRDAWPRSSASPRGSAICSFTAPTSGTRIGRATSAAREIGATTLWLWVDNTFNWDYQLIRIVTEWRSFKTRLWCLFNPAHRTIRTWILAHSTLLASRAFAIPSTFRFLYYLNEAVHKLSRFHTPFKTTPSKCLDSVGK